MHVSNVVTVNMLKMSFHVGRLVQVLSSMDIYNQKLAHDIERYFNELQYLYEGNNIREYLIKLGMKVFIIVDRFYPEPLKDIAREVLDYLDFISKNLYGERVSDYIREYIRSWTGY